MGRCANRELTLCGSIKAEDSVNYFFSVPSFVLRCGHLITKLISFNYNPRYILVEAYMDKHFSTTRGSQVNLSMVMRKPNTNVYGYQFSEKTIDAVWNKATKVPGLSPDFRRKDMSGAFIDKHKYGDTESNTGWEIDHIKPITLGGTDDLVNLQPLQWKENRVKGDDYPYSAESF